MKEYMKMSDVFDGQVVANHGDDFNGWSTVDTALGLSIDESGDGGFEQKTADYVAHAINCHDELVEMNKELLAALEWSDSQIMEFICLAFRHAEIRGDFELSDVRDALKFIKSKVIAKTKGGAA